MAIGRAGCSIAVAVLLVAVASGCGAGAPSAPSGQDSNIAAATPEPSESASSIAPESTGPELPQKHKKSGIAVNIAGPPTDGGPGQYGVDEPDGCAVFHIVDALNEDVRVTDTSVGPHRGFVNAGKGCGGDPASDCVGYVFASGADHTCLLDVRWKPESGVVTGAASIFVSAVCHDRADAMCSELTSDPPAKGTRVTFHVTTELTADPAEPTEDPPTDSDTTAPENSPTDGPAMGQPTS